MSILSISDAIYVVLEYCDDPFILHHVCRELRKYTTISYDTVRRCIRSNGTLSYAILRQLPISTYDITIDRITGNNLSSIVYDAIAYDSVCVVKWYVSSIHLTPNINRLRVMCIDAGNINMLSHLCDSTYIHIEPVDGYNPLHMVVYRHMVPYIQVILNSKVDIDTIDDVGNNALDLTSDVGITTLLLTHGIDVNCRRCKTHRILPIEDAIFRNDYPMLSTYLTYTKDIHTQYMSRYLCYAIMHYDIRACKIMLTHGFNVGAISRVYGTPLHCAVYHDAYHIVKVLVLYMIKQGVSLTTTNHNGYTALEYARSLGRDRIISYLVFFTNENLYRRVSFR